MATYGGDSGGAQQKVNAPALTMLVTAIAFMVIQLVLFFVAPQVTGEFIKKLQDTQAKQGQAVQQIDVSHGPFDYVMLLIQLAGTGVIVFGSMQMRQLQSFPLAMTASILYMIPFISPCCCVGIPIGIWALVTLNKAEVKSAFR